MLGPLLHFRGVKDGRWCLSALIVDDGTPDDFACDAAAEVAEYEELWALDGKVARRCRFEIPLESEAREIFYEVGGSAYPVAIPAKGEAPHIAYGSCNGFSSLKAMKGIREKNHIWTLMKSEHEQKGFNLLLLGGDRVYADSMWERVPEMTRWAELSWDEGNAAEPGDAMKQALRSFYFDLYVQRWRQPEVAAMMARIPSIAMWDDHDLIDGWGSYPEERQNCPVYQDAIWPAAQKAFRTFQQHRRDDEAHPCTIGTGKPDRAVGTPALSLGFRVGPLAILALDMRSQRSLKQVVGADHWDEVYDWMGGLTEAKHLVVMSSIPVVHPGFDLLERVLGILPGYQDLEDDLKDHWRTRAHKGERLRLIHRLLDLGSKLGIRPTIISGDVHVASVGYVQSTRPEHAKAAVVNQLISSGIVHPGPGAAVLFALRNLFDSTDEMDRGVTGRMSEFPGTQDKFVGGRNFMSLRPDAQHRIWANWWVEGMTDDPYTKVIHAIGA